MSSRKSSVVALFALAVIPSLAYAQNPVKATLPQFKQLHWLAGTWRGSGGAYPAFFEEYRFVNDSTVRMRSFTDSTLRVVSDSSIIELRNGTIYSRSERSAYAVIELSPTSIRFMKPSATAGGHTFTRVSDNQWTATLHPTRPQLAPTVYVMRKIAR